MAKLIGGVLVGVLIIGGWVVWQGKQGDSSSREERQETPSPATQETSTGATGMGVVNSIKDAMGLGKVMQCTYSLDQDGKVMQSTVWVDGARFKSMANVDGMEVYGIFDGESQYSWTSATKTGMKISKGCMDKIAAQAKDATETTTQPVEDLRAGFDAAQNVACQPASNPDFSLPTDVTFTDQCAVMEQSLKMMEQIKEQLPAGIEIPNVPNMAY